MKIISPYKDYYDSALAYGVDKTVSFIRKEDSSRLDKRIYNISRMSFLSNGLDNKVHYSLILFCGKVYPCIYYLDNKISVKYGKRHCFYSIEDYIKFVSLINGNDRVLYRNSKKNMSFSWGRTERDFMEMNFKLNAKELHFKYNSPILVIDDDGNDNQIIKTNPSLQAYSFFKVFESYQAYQSIDMYVQGVLGMGNITDLIELNNKCKMIKKGFDKYSFKKRPKK